MLDRISIPNRFRSEIGSMSVHKLQGFSQRRCARVLISIVFLTTTGCRKSATDEISQAIARKNWEAVIDLCNEHLQENTMDAKVMYYRGVAHNAQGDFSAAIEDFLAALNLHEDITESLESATNSKTSSNGKAVPLGVEKTNAQIDLMLAYNSRGFEYIERGEHDKALQDFTNAINHAGGSAESFCGRGKVFLKKGFPDLAIVDFDEAIERQTTYFDALLGKAAALEAIGEHESAIATCLKATRQRPAHAASHRVLGQAYLARKKYSSAAAHLKEAMRLDASLTDEVSSDLVRACRQWSSQLREEGKDAEADKVMEMARQFDPRAGRSQTDSQPD